MLATILAIVVVPSVATHEQRSLIRNENVPHLEESNKNEGIENNGMAPKRLANNFADTNTVLPASATAKPVPAVATLAENANSTYEDSTVYVLFGNETNATYKNTTVVVLFGDEQLRRYTRGFLAISSATSMISFMAYMIFVVGLDNNAVRRAAAEIGTDRWWVRLLLFQQILYGVAVLALAVTTTPVGIPEWAVMRVMWPLRGLQVAQSAYEIVAPGLVLVSIERFYTLIVAEGIWNNERLHPHEKSSGFPATKVYMALSLTLAGPRLAASIFALAGTPSVWMDLVAVLNYSTMMMLVIDLYTMKPRTMNRLFTIIFFVLDGIWLVAIPFFFFLGWYHPTDPLWR